MRLAMGTFSLLFLPRATKTSASVSKNPRVYICWLIWNSARLRILPRPPLLLLSPKIDRRYCSALHNERRRQPAFSARYGPSATRRGRRNRLRLRSRLQLINQLPFLAPPVPATQNVEGIIERQLVPNYRP